VAGPDGHWHVFNTEDFKPPSNPEDWKFGAPEDWKFGAPEDWKFGAPKDWKFGAPEDWKFGALTQLGADRQDLTNPNATPAPDSNHRSLSELLGEPPKYPVTFNPSDKPRRDPAGGCFSYPVRNCGGKH
jgi:hypothetical protein